MTGLWQVSARRDPSFEKNVMLDLEYIQNWNVMLDLKIVLKTIPEVITLVVFSVFSVSHLKQPFRWNHVAGFGMIIISAVGIIFKNGRDRASTWGKDFPERAVPLQRSVQQIDRLLVPEMTHSGENHGQTQAVSRFNDGGIPLRAPGLNDGGGAGLGQASPVNAGVMRHAEHALEMHSERNVDVGFGRGGQ